MLFGLIPVQLPDAILLFITWGTGYRTTEYRDGAWSELAPWVYLNVSLDQVIASPVGKASDGAGNAIRHRLWSQQQPDGQ